MPKHCLGGIAPNGRREYVAVEANTPGEAVRLQRGLGFTDVIYYSPWADHGCSVEDQVRLLTQTSFEVFRRLSLKLLIAGRGLFLAVYLAGAYISFKDGIDVINVILTSIPLMVIAYFAAKGGFFGPANLLQKLGSLICWCRWREALNFLPKTRKYISPFQYDANRAIALTGLGKLTEALSLLKPYMNDPNFPQWMLEHTLARIDIIAQRPAEAIEHFQKAVALNPENDDLKLEYAGTLVRFLKRDVDAQRVLEQIDLDGLSEWQLGLLSALRGNIELQQKSFAAAILRYHESLKILIPYGAARPDLKTAVDLVHARLCLAYAAMKDQHSAQRHFQLAKRRLHLPPYREMLQECEPTLSESD